MAEDTPSRFHKIQTNIFSSLSEKAIERVVVNETGALTEQLRSIHETLQTRFNDTTCLLRDPDDWNTSGLLPETVSFLRENYGEGSEGDRFLLEPGVNAKVHVEVRVVRETMDGRREVIIRALKNPKAPGRLRDPFDTNIAVFHTVSTREVDNAEAHDRLLGAVKAADRANMAIISRIHGPGETINDDGVTRLPLVSTVDTRRRENTIARPLIQLVREELAYATPDVTSDVPPEFRRYIEGQEEK